MYFEYTDGLQIWVSYARTIKNGELYALLYKSSTNSINAYKFTDMNFALDGEGVYYNIYMRGTPGLQEYYIYQGWDDSETWKLTHVEDMDLIRPTVDLARSVVCAHLVEKFGSAQAEKHCLNFQNRTIYE